MNLDEEAKRIAEIVEKTLVWMQQNTQGPIEAMTVSSACVQVFMQFVGQMIPDTTVARNTIAETHRTICGTAARILHQLDHPKPAVKREVDA